MLALGANRTSVFDGAFVGFEVKSGVPIGGKRPSDCSTGGADDPWLGEMGTGNNLDAIVKLADCDGELPLM